MTHTSDPHAGKVAWDGDRAQRMAAMGLPSHGHLYSREPPTSTILPMHATQLTPNPFHGDHSPGKFFVITTYVTLKNRTVQLTPITKSKCGQSNKTVSNQLTKNRCYQEFGLAAKNSKYTKKYS
jgi:hypothetical protein